MGSDARAGIAIEPGAVLGGKFRLEKELASGGMGVVWVAHHLGLERRVAVKLLRSTVLEDKDIVARFMREARATARLRSEHVVKMIDFGMLEGNIPFMVMEYLNGTDLAQLVRKRGPLPAEEVAEYVLQACHGIAEAHRAGIVHRDLKPGNLFLTRTADGLPQVKVLDFGISKVTGHAASDDPSLTQTAVFLGSAQFASPEQVRSSRDVDARSDIWSIGAVMYRLLTAGGPFVGASTAEVVGQILHVDPKPPSELVAGIPKALDDIVMRALSKDPADRHADIGLLAAELAPFAPSTGASHSERIVRLLNTATSSPPSAPPPAAETPQTIVLPATTITSETASEAIVEADVRPPPTSKARYALGAAVVVASLGLVLTLRLAPTWSAAPSPGTSASLTPTANDPIAAPSPSPSPSPSALPPAPIESASAPPAKVDASVAPPRSSHPRTTTAASSATVAASSTPPPSTSTAAPKPSDDNGFGGRR